MKNKVMVTVCCITYNQENYIRDALEGIINQKTNFKYEVIVNDDASTDNTVNIIKEYEKKYPKIIKPIYQIENQYQKGIKTLPKLYRMARGKYITICEGDDYWTDPNKLQMQVDYMETHKECTFIFHNAESIDMETGKKETFVPYDYESKIHMKKDGNYNVAEIELLGFVPTASFMFRQENVSKLPEWFEKVFVGDWPLKLVMTSFGYAHFIDRKMSVYRKNAIGSLTVANRNKEKQGIEQRKKLLEKRNEVLYNIDEFTNYKYHSIFEQQILLNEVDFLYQTNRKKDIIKSDCFKKLWFRRKLKFLIKIYLPQVTNILKKILKK